MSKDFAKRVFEIIVRSGTRRRDLIGTLCLEALTHARDHNCGSKLTLILNALTTVKSERPDAFRLWAERYSRIRFKKDKDGLSWSVDADATPDSLDDLKPYWEKSEAAVQRELMSPEGVQKALRALIKRTEGDLAKMREAHVRAPSADLAHKIAALASFCDHQNAYLRTFSRPAALTQSGATSFRAA